VALVREWLTYDPPSSHAEGASLMWGSECGAPILAPGSRVEVDYGGVVLGCRLRGIQGALLHLSAPPEARRSFQFRDGAPIRLTLYHAGVCLEAEATTREWIWMRPPVLVVGPVTAWAERSRRRAPRVPRQLSARLTLDDGAEYVARTQDISARGVSLLVAGLADIRVGATACLTLQADEDLWCEKLPIRIARVRHWLRSIGRSVELGAEVELPVGPQQRRWQECLERLGVVA
jgi:hypothetical protein